MSRAAAGRLASFDARALANTVWGFAKLGFHPGPLLAELAREAALPERMQVVPLETAVRDSR